jgi:hypothetical protein
MKTNLIALIGALSSVFLCGNAATTRYVDLASPNPAPPYTDWAMAATNIQDAVDASAEGDLILVADGIYGMGGRIAGTATTTTNRVAVTKAITVQSVNGPSAAAIVGFQVAGTMTGNAAVRCIYLTNGATLIGFAITNGATKGEEGGGIRCESTSALISNCWVFGNAASSGAGVYRGTIWNCILSNNVSPAAGVGGGASQSVIYNSTIVSNVAGVGVGVFGSTLSNCLVLGNVGYGPSQGGGAFNSVLTHCVVGGNQSVLNGGGSSASTLVNCIITNNSCVGAGPAFSTGGGVSGGSLVNCIVVDNTSDGHGGGVASSAVTNCVIKQNRAKGNGGGAFNATLVNSLILANTSWTNGGGAYGGIVFNSTIAGNVATNGGGVAFAISGSVLGSIVYHNTAATNDNYGGQAHFSASCTLPAPILGGSGNITNAPNFIDFFGGNLRLQTTSPCINAGALAVGFAFDLDRRPRSVGGRIDMGAYEFQGAGMGEFIGWLDQHRLFTDGSADFSDADGDGANNWQEWRADTSPTNSVSALRLVSATNSPSGAVVTWQSVATRNYWLERATNLGVASPFQTIATNIVGTAGAKTFTDATAAGGGPYFYRVGVQ